MYDYFLHKCYFIYELECKNNKNMSILMNTGTIKNIIKIKRKY